MFGEQAFGNLKNPLTGRRRGSLDILLSRASDTRRPYAAVNILAALYPSPPRPGRRSRRRCL